MQNNQKLIKLLEELLKTLQNPQKATQKLQNYFKLDIKLPAGDQRSLYNFYGKPGEELTRIDLPYKMKLAWDLEITVTRISVHKKVAYIFKSALQEILDHYGLEEIRRLKLDQFGGTYNKRRKRGGNTWSTHAWAIAIDINPSGNPFRGSWDNADFSKAEYKPFLEIMKRHGFKHLKYFDAMHFQLTT